MAGRSSTRDNQTAQGQWEARFADMEAEIARLTAELRALRAEWERTRGGRGELQAEFDALRDAVLRYAVACGAVDVQIAMMRARGDSSGEVAENLSRSLEEQTEASNALRAFARALQAAPEEI
jgi:chromosome segregation ATPase